MKEKIYLFKAFKKIALMSFLLSCKPPAQPESNVQSNESSSQRLTFDQILSLVNRKATVEDAIAALPQSLKSNYTLVKKSRSAQHTDDKNPRAIMFGDDAGVIVTFTGSGMEGGSSLETAEFDAKSNRLFFRSIRFKKDSNSMKPSNSIDKNEIDPRSNDFVEVSKPNPMACMKCHSYFPGDAADAKIPNEKRLVRYIWDDYRYWEGMYGEGDDCIEDVKEFATFKKNLPKRYQWLDLGTEKNSAQPYYDGDRTIARISKNMPNTRLTSLLAVNTIKSLGARIFESLQEDSKRGDKNVDETLEGVFTKLCKANPPSRKNNFATSSFDSFVAENLSRQLANNKRVKTDDIYNLRFDHSTQKNIEVPKNKSGKCKYFPFEPSTDLLSWTPASPFRSFGNLNQPLDLKAGLRAYLLFNHEKVKNRSDWRFLDSLKRRGLVKVNNDNVNDAIAEGFSEDWEQKIYPEWVKKLTFTRMEKRDEDFMCEIWKEAISKK